ncbi:MAG TPA: hypothetical protein VIL85_06185 [Thermomicrobiales bacterium]|jgi:hypothetical protein
MEYHDQRLAEARENLRLAKQARESERLSRDSVESTDEDGLIAKMEERLREMEDVALHRSRPDSYAADGADRDVHRY